MKIKIKDFFIKIFTRTKEDNNLDVIFSQIYTYLSNAKDYHVIMCKDVEYINAYENGSKLLLVSGPKFSKSKQEALKEFNAY